MFCCALDGALRYVFCWVAVWFGVTVASSPASAATTSSAGGASATKSLVSTPPLFILWVGDSRVDVVETEASGRAFAASSVWVAASVSVPSLLMAGVCVGTLLGAASLELLRVITVCSLMVSLGAGGLTAAPAALTVRPKAPNKIKRMLW